MRDVERRLRDLGGAVAFPETPELDVRVRRALTERSPATARRRLVAVVAAVLALGLAAGLAVPQARSAVLRLFGIGAVQVEFVDRLPEVKTPSSIPLGTRIDPKDAPFGILRSSLLGEPDAVYASGDVVTLVYGSPERPTLVVTEIGSAFPPEIAKKLVGGSTSANFVRIRGVEEPGVWIEGAPHVLSLPGAPPRLAANTLVWVRDERTLRVEGEATLGQAVEIAESFR